MHFVIVTVLLMDMRGPNGLQEGEWRNLYKSTPAIKKKKKKSPCPFPSGKRSYVQNNNYIKHLRSLLS